LPQRDHPDYQKLAGSIERQGKNTPIQGTSADITKYALIYLMQRFEKEGWDAYLIHTVHDEIVAEARQDIADVVAEAVKEEMIRAGQKLLHDVPIGVDIHVSDCWEK
jgi:DNA polymerase-1